MSFLIKTETVWTHPMGYLTMSTSDDRRLSDSCISTADVYRESISNELAAGYKGVRGTIMIINVTNCVAGKYEVYSTVVFHTKYVFYYPVHAEDNMPTLGILIASSIVKPLSLLCYMQQRFILDNAIMRVDWKLCIHWEPNNTEVSCELLNILRQQIVQTCYLKRGI